MKPIIKWVGGKGGSLPYIRDRLPKKFNNYYEPFLGGGALLLDLAPKTAFVNDINSELINMYKQIQKNPDEVFYFINDLDQKHNSCELYTTAKLFYYDIRDAFNNNLNSNTAEQAARFIYLNKHCFNGLYRVNKDGKFNVPYNNKLEGKSCTKNSLFEMSELIQNYKFTSLDFEAAVATANEHDFVFLDSPYAPLTTTTFIDYTKNGFDYEDHVRLSNCFKLLDASGAYCMLTNHDTDFVHELYKDYNFRTLKVRRSINSDGSNRTGTEVIITNY